MSAAYRLAPGRGASGQDSALDCIVVGGGLVGASLAYGMASRGASVCLLDEGDVAFRASRANFGIVWVQGKGEGNADYARWTRRAAGLWPDFASELEALTGHGVDLRQNGGYWFGFDDAALAQRQAVLEPLRAAAGVDYQMLDAQELRQRLPQIGRDVVGGSFCPLDGHVNPLKLLLALYAALPLKGVALVNGVRAASIAPQAQGFAVQLDDGRTMHAQRVVLAAGLGNRRLAPMVGLSAPVRPNRGQILVTERIAPFLPCATNKLRQTLDGTVQLGSTEEDVGMDDGTTLSGMRQLAQRAVQTFPLLARARLVRAWGALRVMSPDGFPIYDASPRYAGAFVATCHSGVTLCALHAREVSAWMLGEATPQGLEHFSARRWPDGLSSCATQEAVHV